MSYIPGGLTDDELRASPVNIIPYSEFELEVIKGNIPGHTWFEKYGRIDNVDRSTSKPLTIWNGGGLYTGFPDEVETMEIRSSNGNDTSGGTGARKVLIRNLLIAGKAESADLEITLNGNSWVSLGAVEYSRCSRMKVSEVGSLGHNVGELTLRHTTTTGNIFCVMPAEKNSTVIMADTVPAGKTLYIKKGVVKMSRANGSPGSANTTLRYREDGANKPFVAGRDVEITNSEGYYFENSGYIVYDEKTDFKVDVEDVSDDNTIFNAEYMGFYVDNA
ncbi:MAG: hypothetical protein GY774_36195 [Planctomycetes bacterium]|nr:hypothetical protein [Planctomycetota bacterium]